MSSGPTRLSLNIKGGATRQAMLFYSASYSTWDYLTAYHSPRLPLVSSFAECNFGLKTSVIMYVGTGTHVKARADLMAISFAFFWNRETILGVTVNVSEIAT